ncbi:MAG: PQQ-binding-like beta-propeller repeat protein [Parvibaculum sp.]|uniref:PQQ-like beta-propeller repeat protein n=1 Tax=Parvibaculum sp. TaxID=2024848 RepID=UPI00283E06CF|nr:PQQ-binding-like beta-propeller repeat protein [Parvibaculum sp.]MDR3500870.1 PQQ-binding-like beta-propeller repeat protein [Parvibaculum sp.]
MAVESQNLRRTRVFIFALLAAATLGLAGCDTVGDWFTSTAKPKLPGKRLTVMELETKLEVDPATLDTDVELPKPFENKDWTQPGGTADNAMYHLAAPGKLEKLWRVSAGSGSNNVSRIIASPIVAEGKVFVLDAQTTVRAFDAKSGNQLWKRDLTPEDQDSEKGRGGGVAYDGGKVFVTTGFGIAYALKAGSGDVIWKTSAGVPFRASPTANGGRVFVITSDNQTLCLAQEDGEIIWRHRGISESAGILASTSPAVAGSIVVSPYSSGELFALRVENGTVLWSDSLTRTGNLTSLSELNDIAGRPVIDRDRVFAISHSGRMVSIDLRTGERVWTKDIPGVQTPWVAGEYVFLVTTEQQVVALSRRDGRIRWLTKLDRYEDMEDKSGPIEWSGPLLAGDRLIFVSTSGQAVSVSPYTGKIIGKIDLPGKTLVAPIVADGIVYILTDDGDLVAYR